MADRSLGDRLIGWYGGVTQRHLDDNPTFVRHWLMLGFEAMKYKTRYVAFPQLHPSGNEAYRLFMDSIVDGLADIPHCVLTSIFCPNEIFHAMGLKPVTAEAVASFASGAQAESAFATSAENTGIPETYCSYHRILMGMASSGVLEPISLLASTSVACDANNLTFKALARRWGTQRCYVDVPSDVSRDSIAYVADQLRDMATMTQDVYHASLNDGDLVDLCRCSERTQRTLRDTLPLRRSRYLAKTMTVDLMEMLDFHLSLGQPRAEKLAKDIATDLEQAPEFRGIKLVWAHVSPFFSASVGEQINTTQGAQVVATDMLFDYIPPKDGSTFSPDTPYEFMAERVVRNCFNGPATRRAERLAELAQATEADGVVLFCHWGCKQTAGAAQLIRTELESAGYPTLVLDGDAVQRDNCPEGQMSTRFSAFLELLRARRAHGGTSDMQPSGTANYTAAGSLASPEANTNQNER